MEKGEDKPLLSSSPSMIKEKSVRNSKKNLGEEEAKQESVEMMIKSLKNKFGMGDDPEDAQWINCSTRDPDTGERIEAGVLLMAIEIMPKDIADARAAGLGRSEPNNFPQLAEPADRLHLSAMWNPLYVLKALMGPRAYHACSSIICCALLIGFIIFAGPLINIVLVRPNIYVYNLFLCDS